MRTWPQSASQTARLASLKMAPAKLLSTIAVSLSSGRRWVRDTASRVACTSTSATVS